MYFDKLFPVTTTKKSIYCNDLFFRGFLQACGGLHFNCSEGNSCSLQILLHSGNKRYKTAKIFLFSLKKSRIKQKNPRICCSFPNILVRMLQDNVSGENSAASATTKNPTKTPQIMILAHTLGKIQEKSMDRNSKEFLGIISIGTTTTEPDPV